jgi:hypothetical protein
MKQFLIATIAFLISISSAVAQNLPQGIAYQAVAVKEGPYNLAGQNAPAIYWANKDIQVRFTILEKYPNGSTQYSEVHQITTDDFGVFNLIIGQGDVLSGDFTLIPWELGTAHLQVEIDFDNNGSFKLTSLEKFWSVPYAFVSNNAGGGNSSDSSINALNTKYEYLKNRDKDTVVGNEGVSYQSLDSLNQVLQAEIDALRLRDKDTIVGNELQTLSLTGDSIFISEGNAVKINHPVNLDNDSVNELQTISLANDTITLSNSGGSIPLSEIKEFVTRNTGSVNMSTSVTVYKPNITVTHGTWIRSTPYGYEFRDTSIIDTLNLKSGDRLVLYGETYSNSSGWKNFQITDTSGNTVNFLSISHAGNNSSSPSSSGITAANWTNGAGGGIVEIHLPVTETGTYYINVTTQFLQPSSYGPTVLPRNLGWWYYEIN